MRILIETSKHEQAAAAIRLPPTALAESSRRPELSPTRPSQTNLGAPL
ncbi:hypothetical protein GX48_03974 [Paracoccidioides brasiliensis]|nr:hypothetical protein GX48_03974 [Paracoccidioides brasiliensis]